MTSRECIKNIIGLRNPDRTGFWLGNPHPDTWPILHKYFGTVSEEALRQKLNDDFRWIEAWGYRHPEGKPLFDNQRKGRELSAGGCFTSCESVAEVEAYEWPNPDYLDFSDTLSTLNATADTYRASGFWSPFFHNVCDFFGMEEYFIKLYTHPEVVHAVTAHVVDFYLEANRRFFEAAGELVDAFFFGNDFGTQNDIMISPELFNEFVYPYLKKLTDLGRQYDKQILLHSCGSIYRVIPGLIEYGVDALHPLQARAANMDAETIAGEFCGQVAFIGGIDTQDLLVNKTPAEVKAEVHRIREILGPNLVISPSHEALLPNIPPQNIAAMAEAAVE